MADTICSRSECTHTTWMNRFCNTLRNRPAALANPANTVHAFEPMPAIQQRLRHMRGRGGDETGQCTDELACLVDHRGIGERRRVAEIRAVVRS